MGGHGCTVLHMSTAARATVASITAQINTLNETILVSTPAEKIALKAQRQSLKDDLVALRKSRRATVAGPNR